MATEQIPETTERFSHWTTKKWGIAFINQLPRADASPKLDTVVLAHGARFNSEIWRLTGTIDHLSMPVPGRPLGHRVLAVDMPPLGNFPNTRTTGEPLGDPTEFWSTVLGNAKLEKAIGVFASQSGVDLGYPVVRLAPKLLSGLVMVAPIRVEKFAPSDVPTLIVWGAQDEVITPDHAALAAESFSNVTIALIDDAGHAPYVDQPHAFNHVVEQFARDPASAARRANALPSLPGVTLITPSV